MTEQNNEEPRVGALKGDGAPEAPPPIQASDAEAKASRAVEPSVQTSPVVIQDDRIARALAEAEARVDAEGKAEEVGVGETEGGAEDSVVSVEPSGEQGAARAIAPKVVPRKVGSREVLLLRKKLDASRRVAKQFQREVEETKRAVVDAKREAAEAKREATFNQERLERSAADFDNFRKLVAREKAERGKFANEKVVAEFLPVLDNLERAVQHAQAQAEKTGGESANAANGLIDGVLMVLRQFKSQLEKNGVVGFDSLGEQFDPKRHGAVQQIASDTYETGQVVEVYQRGYMIHDKLLRPAMVVVAKNPPKPKSEAPVEVKEPESVVVEQAAEVEAEATAVEVAQAEPTAAEGKQVEAEATAVVVEVAAEAEQVEAEPTEAAAEGEEAEATAAEGEAEVERAESEVEASVAAEGEEAGVEAEVAAEAEAIASEEAEASEAEGG